MSSEGCLALLLDGPMQSWGHVSRFERRTTALHPTRSGVIGLIAAALGINKHHPDEVAQIARLASLTVTTLSLPRNKLSGGELPIRRLEDYHTVTGIRRASGKLDKDATVQTYRHYLLDARFGVLLEGSASLLEEVAAALRNPGWGVWLGRKCCIPASPLLITVSSTRAKAWSELLRRTGHSGAEPEENFDRIIQAGVTDSGADMIEDTPISFGKPIGERHGPRWIRRLPKSAIPNPAS
jgi:CRISPR system Cascade subunit CasD